MLNYLSSTISIGNGVFGLTNLVTASLWGMTFISDRYILTLVESGGSLYWKKIDTYSDTTATYDMPFTPTTAGLAAADSHEASSGQFLAADDTYLYYLKGNTVLRINLTSGATAGSQTLRSSSGASIPTNALGGIALKGANLYAVSKSQQLLYVFNVGVWAWDASPQNAVRQVSVTELATYAISGLFTQPGTDTDVVVLMKLGSTAATAVKYTSDLLIRKGSSDWSDPSIEIHAAQFKGSILHVAYNNNTLAGTGVLIHRFGDGSTNIVAKERTTLTLSEDRVKAGSGTKVKIAFVVKDGYGLPFAATEEVRFSLVKVGDAYDKNDGALATSESGPFRDSSDNPLNVSLEVAFDGTGKAECWWETPLEVPADVLLHRIKVEYPIF